VHVSMNDLYIESNRLGLHGFLPGTVQQYKDTGKGEVLATPHSRPD